MIHCELTSFLGDDMSGKIGSSISVIGLFIRQKAKTKLAS
ncbi:hypothetical protein DFQ11_101800 [Winogradskyella epiphytica]|uniref:Uncharacterized protein n=1 Tax=Winogradskyella epiphytica TaxID=262005 RepID=A0A2V4X0D8_9FLAO|nr:hypothetical protein DFQ11_101800 [Winogradskyella epiphytica]